MSTRFISNFIGQACQLNLGSLQPRKAQKIEASGLGQDQVRSRAGCLGRSLLRHLTHARTAPGSARTSIRARLDSKNFLDPGIFVKPTYIHLEARGPMPSGSRIHVGQLKVFVGSPSCAAKWMQRPDTTLNMTHWLYDYGKTSK